MKILYLYKWCTFGGVERVLINRALAFKKYGIPVSAKVYFYYSGVIQDLRNFLERNKLKDYLWVTDDPKSETYDYYISIDTEEAFESFENKKIILEYHTSYEEHGKYLNNIPAERVKAVFMPSNYFINKLRKIRADLISKAYVLPNFVIDECFDSDNKYILPNWELKPIVFIGRSDSLKNPHFLATCLSKYRRKYGDKFFLCIVGASNDEKIFIEHIRNEAFDDRVVFYPFIRFERIKAFLNLMAKRNAIFASASKGESFGMSVAEAIFFGLPVLISDIPSHRELVQGDERFLFKVGEVSEFIEKINDLSDNYHAYLQILSKLREKLHEDNFINCWKEIWQKLG